MAVCAGSIPIVAASGKIDRAALPPVSRIGDTDAEGMPSTDTERHLLPIWASVLQLTLIDVQESFFDLGGLVDGDGRISSNRVPE